MVSTAELLYEFSLKCDDLQECGVDNSLQTLQKNIRNRNSDRLLSLKLLAYCHKVNEKIALENLFPLDVTSKLMLIAAISPDTHFQQAQFHFMHINVKIVFTTATPLQLCRKMVVTPVDSPNHIICTADNLTLHSNLLMAINLSSKLRAFDSLSLLVPAQFKEEKKHEQFITFVNKALGFQHLISKIEVQENKERTELRHIIVFRMKEKCDEAFLASDSEELITEMRAKLFTSYEFVTKHMTGINGDLGPGSEATPLCSAEKLALEIGIKTGDSFWEIGCGAPKLAFAFSAASNGGIVIATDENKIYNDVTFASQEFVVENATLAKLSSENPIRILAYGQSREKKARLTEEGVTHAII